MNMTCGRREFLRRITAGSGWLLGRHLLARTSRLPDKPHVVFLLADQWRAQATGYAGDPNARTPHLDALAQTSVNFTNAVSCCPVCSPYRASLMTGRYPLTHGIFLNDLCLDTRAVSIAQAFNQAGYHTGYIGKWHLDGHGRSAYIPPQRRQGFQFWKVLECTHNYNNSFYYGDKPIRRKWNGYDAIDQTREAIRYIRAHAQGNPFALFLSWGPPHAPYNTAPSSYRARFDPDKIILRPNVPPEHASAARRDLAGYYAHIAALDDCIGQIVRALDDCGIADRTVLVFTSDHGDMLYSHGRTKKQQPQDESACVPFLLRYPRLLGTSPRQIDMPFGSPDIMPTLLGLCGVPIPATVEGRNYADLLRRPDTAEQSPAVLIMCPSPFGQWQRKRGGREYRGVRTRRYTYVRDLNGPWLLYDNREDPYQLRNLCNQEAYAKVQAELEKLLKQKLRETGDEFLSGWDYIKKWGYEVDETGTVPYWKKHSPA